MPIDFWHFNIGNVVSMIVTIGSSLFLLGIMWARIRFRLIGTNGDNKVDASATIHAIYMAIGDTRREVREGLKEVREDSIQAHHRLRNDLTPLANRLAVIEYKLHLEARKNNEI